MAEKLGNSLNVNFGISFVQAKSAKNELKTVPKKERKNEDGKSKKDAIEIADVEMEEIPWDVPKVSRKSRRSH